MSSIREKHRIPYLRLVPDLLVCRCGDRGCSAYEPPRAREVVPPELLEAEVIEEETSEGPTSDAAPDDETRE